jgi:SAM-dependent methyltransferase
VRYRRDRLLLEPCCEAASRGHRPDCLLLNTATLFDRAAATYDLAPFPFFSFMPDPEGALRERARVLAPGGRIVMATWGRADPRWAWERDIRNDFLLESPTETLQELGAGLVINKHFDTDKVGPRA